MTRESLTAVDDARPVDTEGFLVNPAPDPPAWPKADEDDETFRGEVEAKLRKPGLTGNG